MTRLGKRQRMRLERGMKMLCLNAHIVDIAGPGIKITNISNDILGFQINIFFPAIVPIEFKTKLVVDRLLSFTHKLEPTL